MNTQRPIPLRPDRSAVAREWRESFVSSATVAALSRIRKTSADEIEREMRGAVSPTKVGDYPGNTVAKLMLLAPQSAAAKLFELAVQIDLAGISSFSFPLPSTFTEAKFVEEGFPIPVGQGVFAGMPLGPVRKVALIAALTNELETASASVASTIIEHVLKIAVGNGLAKVLFSDDAASDLAPAGLLNGVVPIAGSASMSADLGALVGAISAAGIDAENTVLIAAAEQAMAIKLAAGPHFNHRVISAPLDPGTVIAVAVEGLAVAGEGTPEVTATRHSLLHVADPSEVIGAPGAPATIAAPVVSMFQTDSFALKCVARVTWSAAPGAVAWIESATW
ncbi:hypothetical protein [Bradyrhizobium sp. RT4a]|uniref:hypothetical protein n=1 Tax=Bradyrhizobium sp. RT4a TaxID=3158556 RepID=UPI003396DE84